MSAIEFRGWCLSEQKMYFAAYQKILGVLLCKDDQGKNEGKGLPVKEVPHEDCLLLQNTTLTDESGQSIFEGDLLEVQVSGEEEPRRGVAPQVPDMYKSRGLHPLQTLLEEWKLVGQEANLVFKIVGNIYENPKSKGDVQTLSC